MQTPRADPLGACPSGDVSGGHRSGHPVRQMFRFPEGAQVLQPRGSMPLLPSGPGWRRQAACVCSGQMRIMGLGDVNCPGALHCLSTCGGWFCCVFMVPCTTSQWHPEAC
jgi:hypothetical protein